MAGTKVNVDNFAELEGLTLHVEPDDRKLYRTPIQVVPGIGAAVAYTAGDAFGTQFSVPVPVHGRIDTVLFFDQDDEGLAKTVCLFDGAIAQTTDNAALSVSVADNRKSIGHLQLEAADFADMGATRIGTLRPAPGLEYYCGSGQLVVQLQTQGADNIAAGAQPLIQFLIRPLGAA